MAAQKKVAKKKATKKAAAKKTTAKKTVAKKAAAKKAPAKEATTKKAAADSGQIKVTLLRSRHGRLDKHQACLAGLGLRRINQTVTVQDTPAVRGMINKVQYLLKVEEA